VAVAAACALLLGGCSGLEGTNAGGYIDAANQILQVAAADRGAPIPLTGTSLTDRPVDVTAYRGKPVVINVWWSGCGPCRTEMPMLAEAQRELAGKAQFVGIDIRDLSQAAALAFAVAKGADGYPTIYDPSGKAMLAFSGELTPRAPPTTVILDSQGRAAAMISGPIPSKLTLAELVKQIAAEDG